MEKKRKRIQSSETTKDTALAPGSTGQKITITAPEEQKEKEFNYLNKPHMLFK